MRFLTSTLLTLACLAQANASSLLSGVSTPYQNGYEFASNTTDAITRGGNGYLASAQTDYGINRVYAQGAFNDATVIQSTSVWIATFNLTGAPQGTPVNLLVELAYDFTLNPSGIGSASFGIEINGDHYGIIEASTTLNPFASDHCFDRPNQTSQGACAGAHAGVLNLALPYAVGPNQNLSIFTTAVTSSTGLSDAFHTARVTGITLPDEIGWTYQDLPGNPLNFQHALDATSAPEPASMALMAAGLGGILAAGMRRRRQGRPVR